MADSLRPDWCQHPDCKFLYRIKDQCCGRNGVLATTLFHSHRFCIGPDHSFAMSDSKLRSLRAILDKTIQDGDELRGFEVRKYE
jgi:hypothetical protein